MGVDYTVHVGPYVACKNERVDVKKTRRSCTNDNCLSSRHHAWDTNVNFCGKCGSSIGQVVSVEKGDKVSVDSEELEEALYPCPLRDKGTEYWLPNKGRPNKKSRNFAFSPKYDDNFVDDLTPETIADDLQEFKEQYKDAIAILMEKFGKGNAEVKWGIIYYSC